MDAPDFKSHSICTFDILRHKVDRTILVTATSTCVTWRNIGLFERLPMKMCGLTAEAVNRCTD